MEDRFGHKLCFKEEIEFNNLYSWALNEIDDNGAPIGRDLIPWGWTLWFSGSRIAHMQSFGKKIRTSIAHPEKETVEQKDSRIIQIELLSGYCRNGEWKDVVQYSMMGTSRKIGDITLDIRPNDKESDDETCDAWGFVSYTSEVDFIEETVPDTMGFNIMLKPRRFGELEAIIRSSSVNSVELIVGFVDGLYSDWSPSISTNSIKVLTASAVERLGNYNEHDGRVKKLGAVKDFELRVSKVINIYHL